MDIKRLCIVLALLTLFVVYVSAADDIISSEETIKEKDKEKETKTITPTMTPTTAVTEVIENESEIIYTEKEHLIVIKEGNTDIEEAISKKSTESEKNKVLAAKTQEKLKFVKYPYTLQYGTTSLSIEKYKCDDTKCGYWVSASRDGQQVAISNPVWIYPSPYLVVVSEETSNESIKDKTNKTITKTNRVTIKEDPKAAVENVLFAFIDAAQVSKTSGIEETSSEKSVMNQEVNEVFKDRPEVGKFANMVNDR